MGFQDKNISSWIAENKLVLLLAVCSFAVAFGLRAMEYGSWSNPAYSVDGEYIMGTHDAYYWLAGAKGVGGAASNPMSALLRCLNSVTGVSYANFAFWLPAVFAGLCALAAFGWGVLLGGPWAGLTGAVYATSIPAFYFRTRLSYYDTDLITLFFPLFISFLLGAYLLPGLRKNWLADDESKEPYRPTTLHYIYALLGGALTSYGAKWHGDVSTFGMIVFFIAIGLAMVCARRDSRAALLRGLLIYSCAAFWGLPGLAVSVLLVAAIHKEMLQRHKLYDNSLVYLALLALPMIFSGVVMSVFSGVFAKIGNYLKPVAAVTSVGSGPQYPGVAQSIIEAQNIELNELFFNMSGNAALGIAGFAGYFISIAFYPLLLLLLPFAASTLGGMYLGGRFVMFGGIVTGLGLFLSLVMLMKFVPGLKKYKGFLKGAQAIVLTVLLIVNLLPHLATMAPTPIMGAPHAKALIETGKKIKKDSTIWTWWDWGYASMYYAGVNSFANGGNHAGPVLYPLALALSTPSTVQAAQFIKYSASHGNNTAKVWKDMKGEQVIKILHTMAQPGRKFADGPDQYITVSWDNIRLAYWILYYGSFDLVSGKSTHPDMSRIRETFDVNFKTGEFLVKGYSPVPMSTCTVLSKDQPVHKRFNRAKDRNLLFNTQVEQGFMVDDRIFNSMLVQLLIADPSNRRIKDNFELVYDGYPMVRIYKVL
ncbi:STT3 domain-containing protein [Maridesulfovibrio sp.]|uniref:STT3 domain-containing protein n=1 Tax=Maridesulfovibrio sp. TaxID=2795000 RepID=UPI0029F45C90|nr:STT3 domain-containing protein [Maridesulfovibrio sp.]